MVVGGMMSTGAVDFLTQVVSGPSAFYTVGCGIVRNKSIFK